MQSPSLLLLCNSRSPVEFSKNTDILVLTLEPLDQKLPWGFLESICLNIATCHSVMYQNLEQNRERTLVLDNQIRVQCVECVLWKANKTVTAVDARLCPLFKFLFFFPFLFIYLIERDHK